jgi:hypothetical protein
MWSHSRMGECTFGPRTPRQTKVIGVRREKMYTLQFETSRALVRNTCDTTKSVELMHIRESNWPSTRIGAQFGIEPAGSKPVRYQTGRTSRVKAYSADRIPDPCTYSKN